MLYGDIQMKIIFIVSFIVVLFGCENGSLVLSNGARNYEKQLNDKKGVVRIALFKDCMKLASDMPRQADMFLCPR